MNIPINKDFEHDYKSSVWKGFTLVEMVHLCMGVLVAVALCLFLWQVIKLPVVPAIYISIPIGFPILASGFWTSANGLNLWQYRKAIRYRKATRILHSRAEEYKPVPDAFSETELWRKEAQKNKIQKMRKIYRKEHKKRKRRTISASLGDKEPAPATRAGIAVPPKEAEAAMETVSAQKQKEAEHRKLYLNPFEVPEEILGKADFNLRAQFIGQKTDFLEAFVCSCLKGTIPTEAHKTLIVRCVKKLYENVFQAKKPKSPVLGDFCQILLEQPEPEAKDLYAALEPYVNGPCDIFSQDSSQNINDRMIVSGKKNLPDEAAETYMLTAMHLLSMRMDYKSAIEEKN